MLVCSDGGLRRRLRCDLAAHHDALDERFSGLDLCRREGLGRFLRAHRAAFGAMREALPAQPGRVGSDLLGGLVGALDSDLAVLGLSAPGLSPRPGFHARAVDHVVLGSRLGTKVLRQRWAASGDGDVMRAGAYMSMPGPAGAWQAHCDEVSMMTADDAEADRICEDGRRLFHLFAEALDAA
jgi:hypothetical protein